MLHINLINRAPWWNSIAIILSLFLALNLPATVCRSQSNTDFEVVAFDNDRQVSAIEISPDEKTMALGTAGGPVYFWDIESRKVIRKADVSGYPWGPYLRYSSDGKYLLLIQQYFTDFAINKDRPSRAEVMDVAPGNIIFGKDVINSVTFGPDNQSLIGLRDDEVIFWNIQSGKEERKFKPDEATNAIAYNQINSSKNDLMSSVKLFFIEIAIAGKLEIA